MSLRVSTLCVLTAAALLLAACGTNQYEPPVEGKPLTWGQQHYLDNQHYQQLNNDRLNN